MKPFFSANSNPLLLLFSYRRKKKKRDMNLNDVSTKKKKYIATFNNIKANQMLDRIERSP